MVTQSSTQLPLSAESPSLPVSINVTQARQELLYRAHRSSRPSGSRASSADLAQLSYSAMIHRNKMANTQAVITTVAVLALLIFTFMTAGLT